MSVLFCLVMASFCSKKSNGTAVQPPVEDSVLPDPARGPAPDSTWQEHWFEHNKLVKLKYYDTSVVVYYDNEVAASITWPQIFLSKVWEYSRKVYGPLGPDSRLYIILHTGKYGGGHPAYYYDAGHDYRNMIDCGSASMDAWKTGTGNDLDLTSHEIGHIVESCAMGRQTSRAFHIWHDSKWMEIYQFDVYSALEMGDTTRWYNDKIATKDAYPRANTYWFRDWFYPIYSQHGRTAALKNYFQLLAQNFPQQQAGKGFYRYTRDMNYGEFIHFWSGAAQYDLSGLAFSAFGPKDEWGNDWWSQLLKARKDFPSVAYTIDSSWKEPVTDRTAQATLTVSKENTDGANGAEGSRKLVDDNPNTKFYVSGFEPGLWMVQDLGAPASVNRYILVSGDDFPSRDPKSWQLLGSDDNAAWTVLDTQDSYAFTGRNQQAVFTIDAASYRYFKLVVNSVVNSTNFQLSEWRLQLR